jgi:hypothetical protein
MSKCSNLLSKEKKSSQGANILNTIKDVGE